MEIEESEFSVRGETLERIPIPLPDDVIARIEFLAIRNLVSHRNREIHKELTETEIFLCIVDTKNWNGQDYSFAYRIPPLISGSASDSDFFDSDSDDDGIAHVDVFGNGNGGGGGSVGGHGLGGNLNADATAELQHLLQGWHAAMEANIAAAAAVRQAAGIPEPPGGESGGFPAFPFPHCLLNNLSAASAPAQSNDGQEGEDDGEDSVIANRMASFHLGDDDCDDDGNDADTEN